MPSLQARRPLDGDVFVPRVQHFALDKSNDIYEREGHRHVLAGEGEQGDEQRQYLQEGQPVQHPQRARGLHPMRVLTRKDVISAAARREVARREVFGVARDKGWDLVQVLHDLAQDHADNWDELQGGARIRRGGPLDGLQLGLPNPGSAQDVVGKEHALAEIAEGERQRAFQETEAVLLVFFLALLGASHKRLDRVPSPADVQGLERARMLVDLDDNTLLGLLQRLLKLRIPFALLLHKFLCLREHREEHAKEAAAEDGHESPSLVAMEQLGVRLHKRKEVQVDHVRVQNAGQHADYADDDDDHDVHGQEL
mmetsp:Transcript_39115/g.110920  ORF Transcript_39115/g.110920 Transcript_39115/m.110920 type:complete len:311 (-) Transcript_39115:1100-2032(-)